MNVDLGAVERYQDNGYVLVQGMLSSSEVQAARRGVERVMDEWVATGHPYEKVLHQVHLPWKLDAEIADLVSSPVLAAVASQLSAVSDLAVFEDQIVCKPAGGKATIAHQDAPFLSFSDARSLNCWIALDEITPGNGALTYFRGSHRLGQMPLVHLDQSEILEKNFPLLAYCEKDTILMTAGDVVFHNCYTVHRAARNSTSWRRLAFSVQYMELGSKYNGRSNDFLRPFNPEIGQPLDFPCFARPRRLIFP